jgi:hypothetical protein
LECSPARRFNATRALLPEFDAAKTSMPPWRRQNGIEYRMAANDSTINEMQTSSAMDFMTLSLCLC